MTYYIKTFDSYGREQEKTLEEAVEYYFEADTYHSGMGELETINHYQEKQVRFNARLLEALKDKLTEKDLESILFLNEGNSKIYKKED